MAFDANLGSTAGQQPSTTTKTLTTSAAAASNSLIILMGMAAANFTGVISSISGGGLTWTIHESGPHYYNIWIASAPAPSGLAASTVITVTYSVGVNQTAMGAVSFTNMDVSGTREDASNTEEHDNSVINSANWTGEPVTTTEINDIIFCAVGTNDTSGNFSMSSFGSSFTEIHDPGTAGDGFGGFATSYLLATSPGTYTPSGTWSGVQNSDASYHVTVALKELPTPPQEVRPDADTTTTGWSTAPLFSKINDESDATVITSTAS